jgi:hypothetical protein
VQLPVIANLSPGHFEMINPYGTPPPANGFVPFDHAVEPRRPTDTTASPLTQPSRALASDSSSSRTAVRMPDPTA